MRKHDSRRISILDLMILVGATAMGLWLKHHSPPYLWPGGMAYGLSSAVFLVWGWTLNVFPFLIPLGPTLMILHLRRPRPSWRRLSSCPGFTACVASTIGLVIGIFTQSLREVVAAMTKPSAIFQLPSPPFLVLPNAGPGIPEPLGATTNFLSRILLVPLEQGHAPAIASAVVVTWAMLVVGGRWQPQPTWLDRAGRGLGLAWIAAAFILETSSVIGEFMM